MQLQTLLIGARGRIQTALRLGDIARLVQGHTQIAQPLGRVGLLLAPTAARDGQHLPRDLLGSLYVIHT